MRRAVGLDFRYDVSMRQFSVKEATIFRGGVQIWKILTTEAVLPGPRGDESKSSGTRYLSDEVTVEGLELAKDEDEIRKMVHAHFSAIFSPVLQ